MATRVNGRYPDAEVLVTFGDQDRWSYSKTKMDLFRASGGLEKLQESVETTEASNTFVPKKEDVKLVMTEMEVTKSVAEKALVDAKGDLRQALERLVFDA